ncbi:MAG: SDR family oxidoreductase [Verrucomicrobiota bacterium]|nr:SDR family oxidoreductase [Verrucomicrobiota bacterium]
MSLDQYAAEHIGAETRYPSLTLAMSTLARELAPEIRANAIMPGVIETRHHEVATSPERMEQYRRETPLGRNGTAEEVAQAALYLASDASAFNQWRPARHQRRTVPALKKQLPERRTLRSASSKDSIAAHSL